MATKGKGVPVSTRALIQRINRKLAERDEQLKATRGARAKQDLGDYYTLDIRRNFVIHKDLDLEQLGRELDCLAKWEHVADDE